MKGITKSRLKQYLKQMREMFDTIKDGVYGDTNFKPEDYEQQHKHIRIGLAAIMGACPVIIDGLMRLTDDAMPLVEEPEGDHIYGFRCVSSVDDFTTDCPEEVISWLGEHFDIKENRKILVKYRGRVLIDKEW